MAGEFKEYDILFASNKGKTFENICAVYGKPAREDWEGLKSWNDFMPGWGFQIHGRDEIRDAVYRAPGFQEWQKFRVGLHGLSTDCKLWCLAWYFSQEPRDTWRRIRIENYLGALIRGGQLNDKLEIVR